MHINIQRIKKQNQFKFYHSSPLSSHSSSLSISKNKMNFKIFIIFVILAFGCNQVTSFLDLCEWCEKTVGNIRNSVTKSKIFDSLVESNNFYDYANNKSNSSSSVS